MRKSKRLLAALMLIILIIPSVPVHAEISPPFTLGDAHMIKSMKVWDSTLNKLFSDVGATNNLHADNFRGRLTEIWGLSNTGGSHEYKEGCKLLTEQTFPYNGLNLKYKVEIDKLGTEDNGYNDFTSTITLWWDGVPNSEITISDASGKFIYDGHLDVFKSTITNNAIDKPSWMTNADDFISVCSAIKDQVKNKVSNEDIAKAINKALGDIEDNYCLYDLSGIYYFSQPFPEFGKTLTTTSVGSIQLELSFIKDEANLGLVVKRLDTGNSATFYANKAVIGDFNKTVQDTENITNYADAYKNFCKTLGLTGNSHYTWDEIVKCKTAIDGTTPLVKEVFDNLSDNFGCKYDEDKVVKTLGNAVRAFYIVDSNTGKAYYLDYSSDTLTVLTNLLNSMSTDISKYLKDNDDYYSKMALQGKYVHIFDDSTLYPLDDYKTVKPLDVANIQDPTTGQSVSVVPLGDVYTKLKNVYNPGDTSTNYEDASIESMWVRMGLAVAGATVPFDSGCDATCEHNIIEAAALSTHKGYNGFTPDVDLLKNYHLDFNNLSASDSYYNSKPVKEFAAEPHQLSYGFLYDILLEYLWYTTDFLDSCVAAEQNDPQNLPEDIKHTLSILERVYETYNPCFVDASGTQYLDTIVDIGHSSDKNKTLRYYFEFEGVDPSNSTDPTIYDDASFIQNLDKFSPLGNFYILNSTYGYANIDRESIWNEYTGNQSQEAVDSFNEHMAGMTDSVGKEYTEENILEYTGDSMYIRDDGEITIKDNLGNIPDGYAENGYIDSAKAVTMSDYIVTGMTYSATYVPLRTNVYEPTTVNSYDETFREEFFYKYGYMRKALLWDKSATSVMDYLNANNKLTNNLEVITLRDLMEAPGDVSLYVDDDFYNAEDAIEQGNAILTARLETDKSLVEYLDEFYDTTKFLVDWASNVNSSSTASDILAAASFDLEFSGVLKNLFLSESDEQHGDDMLTKAAQVEDITTKLLTEYNFNMMNMTMEDAKDWSDKLSTATSLTEGNSLDSVVLKDKDYISYSVKTQGILTSIQGYEYAASEVATERNYDNLDSIVLPSSLIKDYMDGKSMYIDEREQEDSDELLIQQYETYDGYTPLLSLAYVSAIYRDSDSFSLANEVSLNNPIFLASKDVCGLSYCTEWYANTLINYAFVKNLKSAAQIDYSYVMDLDCPLYVDVFGNVLTESGLVVIPAASNMTLHNASYKNSNVAAGLYCIYGNSYYVPLDLAGAANALFPFFTADLDDEVYVIDGKTVDLGSEGSIKFNEISPYDSETQKGIMHAYRSYVQNGSYTNLNWVAMVNICNEVMRGAPVDYIDKEKEELNVAVAKNKAGVVAAVKLEELIKSLEGMTSNSLLQIPDFSRMDDMEYLVAFLIKMVTVATAAVIIIGVYRDGVSGELGLRTFWKSISGIALTFSAICIVPAVFQLTYYASNKFLLQEEAFRILMYNQEKYQSGAEIDMLELTVPEGTTDMALQLDWISVPWYEQIENMLYGSTLQNLDTVKRDAYLQSPIADNYDVELYNDGVYVTCESLFNSVNIDYTFYPTDSEKQVNALVLNADNTLQTASFYSPYYAFLTVLTGNVNEYNQEYNTHNYTTKYQSGNRCKTVGLCNMYFTSKQFMEYDIDIMHLHEIYGKEAPDGYNYRQLFTAWDTMAFSQSGWYAEYEDKSWDRRVELMDNYARDFIANNKDLLTKVTDETFLEAMALYMATKYNQLFGMPYANALEIYNMDSNDLLRLSIAPTEDAVMNSPMGYARYVYNLGGEPAVYAAAVLTVIMWLGSFIKPLCTVIVFISVFLSIWFFRVVLRKPSANLWGYLITCLLLCGTNVLHSIILKVSTYLPNMGLPVLPCLLFIIFGQVVYLLVLSYVTGVSLKDWSNLGYTEYEKEARRIRKKLGKESSEDMLSGRIKHHENNWEYYDDLVKQHRSRNA